MAAIVLPFVEAERIGFVTSQDRIYQGNLIYVMLGTSTPAGPSGQNKWHTVDVTEWGVPIEAKAVLLDGILIITHGENQQTADLRVTFRRPSDTDADPTKYLGQTSEGNIGGGQRSNFSTWVAVENGKLDYAFYAAGPIGWPAYASYGINLGIQAYAI